MGETRKLLLVGVSLIAMAGAPAAAADFNERFEGRKPAVSGVNGKIEFGYLYLDFLGGDADMIYGIGSFSAPIGHSFGIQVDAGLGRVDTRPDITLGGVGVHGFWRDPDQGLLGVYGHHLRASSAAGDATAWQIGVEGEAYFERITIEAFAGADVVRSGGVSNTFFSGNLTAAFYVTDNLRIHAGVGHSFDETVGKIGAEAILPFAANNVAIFGDGSFGSDTQTYRVGLRVYFGEGGKSLKARHREDDPRSRLFDAIPTPAAAPAAAPPPPPPPPPPPSGA